MLCPQPPGSGPKAAVWQYNMPEHIRCIHPGHQHINQIPATLQDSIVIKFNEELAMGILKEQIPPPLSLPAGDVAEQGSNTCASGTCKCKGLEPLPAASNTKVAHFQ